MSEEAELALLLSVFGGLVGIIGILIKHSLDRYNEERQRQALQLEELHTKIERIEYRLEVLLENKR